jgi:cell fate regulator YaaT (PSP1 superfamily)
VADLFLVNFKGSRREFFYNTYYHTLRPSDYVIIQAEQGEDMGVVSKAVSTDQRFPRSSRPRSILRRAGEQDRTRFAELREKDAVYKAEFITSVRKHGLAMKIVDVECQFDGSKITFFFTAEQRVDFRALVRDLAAKYRTRIELRQIGVRDEAQRIGGYGICGREQCCSSHIRNFAPISTQHARVQDLSLNPSKISGNCGRLLCCLRYEAEQYSEVKRKFPAEGSFVKTQKGNGSIERIDIFTEEAIVIDEENLRFRAGLGEITEVVSSSSRRDRQRQTEYEYDDETNDPGSDKTTDQSDRTVD